MRISDQRGFALFGLLLAAALIAASASFLGLEMRAQMMRDREKMLMESGRELQSAIASYHKRVTPLSLHSYPESLDDLLEDRRGTYIVKHLRSIPIDPITLKREWGVQKVAGRIICIHSLSRSKIYSKTAAPYAERYSDWNFCHPTQYEHAI